MSKISSMSVFDRALDRVGALSLEQGFIIFSVIYLPFAVLLNNQGVVAEALLALYTFVLGAVGLMLIAKFVVLLAKHANDRSGQYGTLLVMYFLNVFFPLVMAKVWGIVIMQLLPERHVGLMCDLVRFVKLLMFTFQWQQSLNLIILASLAVFVGMAVWHVGRK